MGSRPVTTKKILVAYDPSKPEVPSSDFLAPVLEESYPRFLGLRSRKVILAGMMVYLGRDVTVNDLFAKLVDTGCRIESVDQTLKNIEAYLRMLQEYRIGNILAIEPSAAEPCGFQLRKLANTPATAERKLP